MTVTTPPMVRAFVDELSSALGGHLVSVVLYGSAARGDFVSRVSDFNLLVVVDEVSTTRLEQLAGPVAAWRRQRQPMPRIFSRSMLESSSDVFPIEFHEILQCHVVLAGHDVFADMIVHHEYLRLQCERELREKLLRLEEAYIEVHERPKAVVRLMMESYSAFAAIFRGCLTLLGGTPPVPTHDVVVAFCGRAMLDVSVFDRIERLRKGDAVDESARALFDRYHEQLKAAVGRVDRFVGRVAEPALPAE